MCAQFEFETLGPLAANRRRTGSRAWNKIARCIEWVSSIHALQPGDVLATGTNHRGLGAFQHGDKVELEVAGCGRLAIDVTDALGRTWNKQTRLERVTAGLTPDTAPQLSGKYSA